MERALKLLVIEDNVDDLALYRRALKATFGSGFSLTEEANGDGGLAAIDKAEPDCVLLDYSLPGRNGLEVLKSIRARHAHLPVILLTGQGNEAIAVQAMKEGAQDYITKATITAETLGHVIRSAMEHGALQNRVADQHAALEIFAHALAHDLKEPVRTVCSFTQAISDGQIEDAARGEYMRHIRDAGERMALLIDSVLSYTQLDGLAERPRETIDLDEALAAAKLNLAALFGERGTAVTADPLPKAAGVRIQVIQVLQNLMANAISHSPKPVHLRIGTKHEGGMVRVLVHDDGPGIAPDDQRRIFEPFRRLNRDNGHCGLGLAICRKIVEAQGGKMDCQSALGLGSTFFFTLPAAEPDAATAAPRIDADMAKEPRPEAREPVDEPAMANVLLIDDRDDDIFFMRALLTGPVGLRCNLLIAHDGREGLARLRERIGTKDPVDLILLDINMPVMNGFEMLETMREDSALGAIPVVMCSGSIREKDKNRSHALGATGYLAKPVRLDHLRPAIANSVGIRLADNAAGPPTLLRVA
jgi:signal transduction histidine kinase